MDAWFHPKAAIVGFDYGAANCKTHSLAIGLCCEKPIENSFDILRVDARSGVLHRKDYVLRAIKFRLDM
jgi:hypothetical protein